MYIREWTNLLYSQLQVSALRHMGHCNLVLQDLFGSTAWSFLLPLCHFGWSPCFYCNSKSIINSLKFKWSLNCTLHNSSPPGHISPFKEDIQTLDSLTSGIRNDGLVIVMFFAIFSFFMVCSFLVICYFCSTPPFPSSLCHITHIKY